MNVLSIGNSFSQDAQRYIHQIARADKFNLEVFNLYVPGCQLSKHFRLMMGQLDEYVLELNGTSTGIHVSLDDALLSRDWDVITFQQASLQSPKYETYEPYLDELVAYVKNLQPKAKLAIHQTWAYEQGSPRMVINAGYADHKDMFRDIQMSYQKAADSIQADFLIPSGEVFQAVLDAGIEKVHRDSYHASKGLGRYALGLIWYATLTGRDITDNPFCDFDEEVSAVQMQIIKKCVMDVHKSHCQ